MTSAPRPHTLATWAKISARSSAGDVIPLIDGGAFDWVAKLAANRRLVMVASGMGAQLAPLLFRPAR